MGTPTKVIGRPAHAESYRWNGDENDLPAEWRALDMFYEGDEDTLVIRTNRGPTPCYLGDYIIRRKAGDFYPVDPVTYAERWLEQ